MKRGRRIFGRVIVAGLGLALLGIVTLWIRTGIDKYDEMAVGVPWPGPVNFRRTIGLRISSLHGVLEFHFEFNEVDRIKRQRMDLIRATSSTNFDEDTELQPGFIWFHYAVEPNHYFPHANGDVFTGQRSWGLLHQIENPYSAEISSVNVNVPHWAATAGLVLGLIVSLHIRRRLGPKPGHCQSCEYDLRATPDRCPECGTAAVAAGAGS